MQFKRKLKKYIISLLCMILAAYGAIFIKDSIDAKNPEKSLPIISVSTGYTPPYVVRAGYAWNFGFKTIRSPYLSAGDVPMMITDCRPGETIVITFSAPYEFVDLYMAPQREALSENKFDVQYTWTTPAEEGVYIYKIDAHFTNGEMIYYFAVQVKTANLIA